MQDATQDRRSADLEIGDTAGLETLRYAVLPASAKPATKYPGQSRRVFFK